METGQEPGGLAENAGARPVGDLLREGRERRNLTRGDVGRLLRFSERQIRAVEEGRLDELPPQPYARGLVAAYAALLGLEAEFARRGCGPFFEGRGEGGRGTVFHYPPPENVNWRDWTVPLVFGFGALLYAVARSALAPTPGELRAPTPNPVAVRELQAPAAPERSASVPDAGPAPASGVRVLLRSEGTTWVDAAADGGEMTRYDLGPGQNLVLAAGSRLAVTLGDAGVVRVRVNDRELGFIGFKGETKKGLLFAAPQVPATARGLQPREPDEE